MAAVVTSSALQSDPEKGQDEPGRTRLTGYVQDITCKVIPFCIGFLIVLSVGAILVITLNFREVIPAKELVVVSIMLLVFFLLFCIGGMFLYHRKHYPPLTKGPNAPDRPPPEHKTLKDKASIIGTLMVGKLKLGKIHHHHHHGQNEVEPQGVPGNPSELPSSTFPREHHGPQQSSNLRPSSRTQDQSFPGYGMRDKTQLNDKASQKVPTRKSQRSPHSRHTPLTPSHEPIPEGPEETEQYHTQNDRETLVSQRWDTRYQRTPHLNGDGVSPMSHHSNANYTSHYSYHSPESQMRGANRNILTHNGSPRFPSNPHGPESTGSPRVFPVQGMQPHPQVVHINAHNTDPLANVVRIPATINDLAFTEVLDDNCLYIINNQLCKLDGEPKETRSGCKCNCKCDHINKPRSQVHEPKTDVNSVCIDVAKELITNPEVSKVQVPQDVDLLSENGVPKYTFRPASSYYSRAETRGHKAGKKLSTTSSKQKENPSKTVEKSIGSPSQFTPPELPSPPPKAKPPPSRQDPEPFGTQEDRRRKTYFTDNDYSLPKRNTSKRFVWGQPVPTRRRNPRRAPTMMGPRSQNRRPQKYLEKDGLGIHMETGYPGHYGYGSPFVPPRGSSLGFSDVCGEPSKTVESSCDSISSDYRQYE
ncbi:hypothetical protein F4806DRAFT_507736 [Annulohypoxylon nitens]|nr:hypothetical protein F4806DRAFT_507736 [Annulohypoxylon nitens]